jgi:carbonic anhydrase
MNAPHHHDCQAFHSALASSLTRRSVLGLGAFGAGVAALGSFGWPMRVLAGGNTEALLLSCMDFRLVEATHNYMRGRKLEHNYDHIVLAGAGLGAVTDKFTSWNETFWQHLQVAMDLHHIKKLIVLDHRDCGAYRVVFGQDFGKDPSAETKIHSETCRKLVSAVKAKHATIEAETFLMSLDGKVEAI